MSESNLIELPDVYVTTAKKADSTVIQRALQISNELNSPYAERHKKTIVKLYEETNALRLLVVAADYLSLHDRQSDYEYRFHPNLGLLRGLNIQRGWRDLFAEATELGPGDSILDCTVGYACEATLASIAVGEEGHVIGLESVPELALITRYGVNEYPMHPPFLRDAMRRVQIVNDDYRNYLLKCAPQSFDVVYFDPFFENRLPGCEHSMNPLFIFGNQTPIDIESVYRARIAAKKRVVIKHPRNIDIPEALTQYITNTVFGRKSRVVYDILSTTK